MDTYPQARACLAFKAGKVYMAHQSKLVAVYTSSTSFDLDEEVYITPKLVNKLIKLIGNPTKDYEVDLYDDCISAPTFSLKLEPVGGRYFQSVCDLPSLSKLIGPVVMEYDHTIEPKLNLKASKCFDILQEDFKILYFLTFH